MRAVLLLCHHLVTPTIYVPSDEFCFEPKTVLKTEVCFLKKSPSRMPVLRFFNFLAAKPIRHVIFQ